MNPPTGLLLLTNVVGSGGGVVGGGAIKGAPDTAAAATATRRLTVGVLKSVLQKLIRRGRPESAVRVAWVLMQKTKQQQQQQRRRRQRNNKGNDNGNVDDNDNVGLCQFLRRIQVGEVFFLFGTVRVVGHDNPRGGE